MSQEGMDMDAEAAQGTAKNPPAGTAASHKSYGESQVNGPKEEVKGVEEASTLSSSGASAVHGPQPVGPTQLIHPPKGSHHIKMGQALTKEDFDLQLIDTTTLE